MTNIDTKPAQKPYAVRWAERKIGREIQVHRLNNHSSNYYVQLTDSELHQLTAPHSILKWALFGLVAGLIFAALCNFANAFDYSACRKAHGASYCRSAMAACESGHPGSYNKWCPQ